MLITSHPARPSSQNARRRQPLGVPDSRVGRPQRPTTRLANGESGGRPSTLSWSLEGDVTGHTNRGRRGGWGTNWGPHVMAAAERQPRQRPPRTDVRGSRRAETSTGTSWGSRGRRFESCRPDRLVGVVRNGRNLAHDVLTIRNAFRGLIARNGPRFRSRSSTPGAGGHLGTAAPAGRP
jgi:hypothetical protein